MKRILSYIYTLAATALLVAGCATDPAGEVAAGKGRLMLDLGFDDEVATRTVVEAPENVSIKIGKRDLGYTHVFESLAEFPEELWLASGDYFIEVTGGDPTAPGFTRNLNYRGEKDFTISDGTVTPIVVNCTVATTLVTLGFDEEIGDWLTDYKVTLFPVANDTETTIVFDEETAGQTAYFDLGKDQTEVAWKFEATHVNEAEDPEVVGEGAFAGLERGKNYKASFKYTYSEKEGRLVLSVTVDETTEDIGTDITILQKPAIEGHDFDQPITPGESHTLRFIAAGDIEGINFSGSVFGEGFEVIAATETERADYGIAIGKINNGYEMTLSMSFFEQVALFGADPVIITATDQDDRTTTVSLVLGGSAFAVETVESDIWATRALVAGVNLTGEGAVRFAYRPLGGEWAYAAGEVVTGVRYEATLTGLQPATQYEFDIELDGVPSGQSKRFTTAAATPLYNGGFENWNQTGGVWYAGESGVLFWDSGNKGTVTAPVVGSPNNNITTGENDPRPGSTGSKSAKLRSSWFGFAGMGAFAAGNLYTGEFLEARANLSNPSGRVRFGRPFTGRPTAMSVWYKGSTGTVNYAKSGAPLSTGDQDQYQIVIALVDGNFPREVDTADWNTIFKWDVDPDVIAFGEIHGSDTVDWTEATIPLTYRSLDRIPTHIVVLACASRYGDYFTGSTSSVLYVDDFELVYDGDIVLQD